MAEGVVSEPLLPSGDQVRKGGFAPQLRRMSIARKTHRTPAEIQAIPRGIGVKTWRQFGNTQKLGARSDHASAPSLENSAIDTKSRLICSQAGNDNLPALASATAAMLTTRPANSSAAGSGCTAQPQSLGPHIYPLRMASTGLSRAARTAGIMPAMIPTTIKIEIDMINADQETAR